MARRLPPVDLVLAEGFRREPVPRVEVHRRSVERSFLCARDRRVFAVVTDEDPPRALPAFRPDEVAPLAELLCTRFGLPRGPRRRPLRGKPGGSTLRAHAGERSDALGGTDRMERKTSRKGGRAPRGAGHGGRSAAGRKGGNATLRSRGPAFYSEIGRKGGRSRSRKRLAGVRGRSGSRAGSRAGGRRPTRRTR